jgi:predicted ATP-grasp superfamily ATP-dependent carboligase
MRVLVTDGNQRSTLAITRSLGRRGISVLVGEATRRSLASSSRYSSGHVAYPSPYQCPDEFYHFLTEFLRKARIDALVPITDVTTHIVAAHREELERHARLVVPDFQSFDFVTNKWALLKYAQAKSIPVPETHFVQDPAAVPAVLSSLRYPVVVKPARSWTRTEHGWVSSRVSYVGSESTLLRLYREKEYLRYPSLIQNHINGSGLGVFVLFNRGIPVTFFSHRRLRELPPSGGVSVLRESIPVDPVLKEHAVRLLQPLVWHGVAMIEYRLDGVTREPVLMEVNGRFWGSLQLAIDAGVDFPFLVYQMATGAEVEAPSRYTAGVKTRWLMGDLMHTLHRVLGNEEDLHLPPGFPSRGETLASFLKFREPGLRYEDPIRDDLRPFLFELSEQLSRFFGRKTSDA